MGIDCLDINLELYISKYFILIKSVVGLASHTIHVVRVNFICDWRDLQFNVDSERQIFEKLHFMAVLFYSCIVIILYYSKPVKGYPLCGFKSIELEFDI